MDWIQDRINSLLDNFIFLFVSAGVAAMITWIKEANPCLIVGIPLAICLVGFFILRLVAYIQVRIVITRLVNVGIFNDVSDNILRVINHDKSKLKIGLPDRDVMNSNLDKLVYGELRSRNIVRLDKRQIGDFWILTKTGEAIITYIENHPQVLHKEGSRHQ